MTDNSEVAEEPRELFDPLAVVSWVERGIVIDEMVPAEVDKHPFGIIVLDERGRILEYNDYESSLARMSREEVVGKNFFFDVAPCTRVRAFYGRFLRGIQAGHLYATFEFRFEFDFGHQDVEVTLALRTMDQTVWVLVRWLGSPHDDLQDTGPG